jgi:hypothetical protein
MESVHVLLMPTPAYDFFNVSWPEADALQADIQIFNMNGQLMYNRKDASSNIQVDVQAYPSGLYLLRWTNGAQQQTIKWVKF